MGLSEGHRNAPTSAIVCLPDVPELRYLGELPTNLSVVILPHPPSQLPDLSQVELLVPGDWARQIVLAQLGKMTRLRVIQTVSTGVEWLRGRVPPGVVVCNARGVCNGPMAEWVVGAILAMKRGLIAGRDAQLHMEWHSFESEELAGLRAIILGFGSIGVSVAERLRPFGVNVIGVARVPREGVLGIEDLDEVLPSADILIDLLPLSAETVGLLDARRLGLLRPGALLVNAGRGATVDTLALVDIVQSGRLYAVLDVTDPEPLPPDHPLWRLPGILITPHVAGNSSLSLPRAYALAGDQIRRFTAGVPLENQVPPHLLI
jgi:phosphoglycerate dehydrogenase-like enzyme